MDKATTDTKRTIAVLSPDYLSEPSVKAQWTSAFRRDMTGEEGTLLPIHVRECGQLLSGLLGTLDYIDLVGLDDEQKARGTLLAGVRRGRAKPRVPPRPPKEIQHSKAEQPRFPGAFPLVWNVAYQRNPFFTGREEVLRQLYDTLRVGKSVALVQTQALTGLGGIGKTQIAVEYLYRYYSDYPAAILWARANSRDLLVSDLVSIASTLSLPESVEQDQTLILSGVKRWMKEQSGWLLIIDNIDDLEMVKEFISPAHRGHILLTTRTQALGMIAESVEVKKLERDEGALLLLRRTKAFASGITLDDTQEAHRAAAREISSLMDGLPLALDQAGAYIEETQCGLSSYLDLYKSRRSELLKRRGMASSAHPQSVTTTFSLSFERVRGANPAAAELLKLCAFLSPDLIPEEIVTKGAPDLGRILRSAANSPIKLDRAVAALLKFSLVQRDPTGKTLTIHRLVQSVLVDRMDKRSRRLWAERAVRAVNAAFPDASYELWGQCIRYIPHAQVSQMLIERYGLVFLEAARLLYQVGSYFTELANYSEAEHFLQGALSIREQLCGHDHPETASSLNALGTFYYVQGKDELAEHFLQEALSIREQLCGHDHLDTAGSLNALGILYSAQGRDEQAEPFLRRALTIREQALGPEHPDTMNSLSNLATLYSRQGRDELAETLFQQILSIQERVLGLEHPGRASSLNNLAVLNSRQGKDELAEALFQQALTIREQALGPSHPETASSLENLAIQYSKLGKDGLAEPLLQRTLAIREEALGPDHPDTIGSQKNLADLRNELNKDEPSEPQDQQSRNFIEKMLGLRRSHKSRTRRMTADPSNARDRQALGQKKRVLDQRHDNRTFVKCTEPGIIRDEELLAYLAGEPVRPMVQLHLARCPYCSSLLGDYRQTEHLLISKLYRWDCPPNQVLGDYQLNLLSHDRASDVKMHLIGCALCAAEVALLAQFMEDDPLLVEGTNAQISQIEHHHAPQEARDLEDHLRNHWGTRRIVATLIPPEPRMAYQRQIAPSVWPRRYTAEDFSISLQIEKDLLSRDSLQLIGFITRTGMSLEALQWIPVMLLSQTNAVYTKNIDELGNFLFTSITPATYTLEVQLSDSTIVVEQLSIVN